MANLGAQIEQTLLAFRDNCKDFCFHSSVAEISEIPTSLQFYREFVSTNRPVIIRGGISQWPSVTKWTPSYLRQKAGHLQVTVAVTPDGYADDVKGHLFLLPEERLMLFGEFLDIMEAKIHRNGIFYVQKQNSNFVEEFSVLKDDVDDVTWATEAFGRNPDAVNFWMGDGRAVTSMHRDHYENIYCVVSGKKEFTLLPPTDLPWVPYEEFRTATYRENRETGAFNVELEDGKVPWIPLNADKPDYDKYPAYRNATVMKCAVGAGDVLYLPSLWFHHVKQSHACIAVNYWYDMEFDVKYCYYKLLESLKCLQDTNTCQHWCNNEK